MDADKEVPAWIALIEPGSCLVYSKDLHAQLAGAAADIVYDHVDPPANMTIAQNASDIHILCVSINQKDGQLLRVLLTARARKDQAMALLEPARRDYSDI
eukprot:jgi/Chlat1/5782/Chrsp387S05507